MTFFFFSSSSCIYDIPNAASLFVSDNKNATQIRTHTHTHTQTNQQQCCHASSSNSHSQLPSILGNVLRIYKNGMCVNWLDDGMGALLGVGEHGGWLRYLGKELGLD